VLALPADPGDPLGLEDAEQLGLDRERQLTDLVEEDGAAVALLEDADLLGGCPRERALFVPEQLTLGERLGQRGAVEDDQRAGRARRPLMQDRRGQLLAGPGLAAYQHGELGLRQAVE
jgi:hypothetical protein